MYSSQTDLRSRGVGMYRYLGEGPSALGAVCWTEQEGLGRKGLIELVAVS